MASCPTGPLPEPATVPGPQGSLLNPVIVPDCGPRDVGAKRMGTSIAAPGAMVKGNAITLGTRNSADDEVMAVTVRTQLPAFVRVNGLSADPSRQTLPKLPAPAIIVTSLGAGAVPETGIALGLVRSSLVTVIDPTFAPKLVGMKRIGTSIDVPAARTKGNDTTAGT